MMKLRNLKLARMARRIRQLKSQSCMIFTLSVCWMNLSANTGPSGASAAAGAVDPHLHRRAILRPAPDSCLTTALHRVLAAQKSFFDCNFRYILMRAKTIAYVGKSQSCMVLRRTGKMVATALFVLWGDAYFPRQAFRTTAALRSVLCVHSAHTRFLPRNPPRSVWART